MVRSVSFALAGAALALARPAAAQAERIAVRGEGGGGAVLSAYQRDELGYRAVVQGSLRLNLSLFDALSLQASTSSWFFPDGTRLATLHTFTGGVRLEPRVGGLGRIFVDGNAGLGITGDKHRVALDTGLGFEFQVGRGVGLGPYVRYGVVLANAREDEPTDGHGHFVVGGLVLRFGGPWHPAEPAGLPDLDRDGVLDLEDMCLREAAGPSPDPERRGCPLRDADGDGVSDRDDVCLNEPAGPSPDPERRGCPQLDGDGDGVFDRDDRCPATPQGPAPDPERRGCPDGDDDGDGVLNHADQCRVQHHGTLPDATRPGCPTADRDSDTVPDPVDRCPDQPGAPSPDPQRNGCPGLVIVQPGQIRITSQIFFALDSDRILPRSELVLQAVADALTANAAIRRVSIEGHTDSVGDDAHNLELSQRRANSVLAWLVQHGVEAARLEAHGYGETRPLVSNATRQGRATNRRVEFRIVEPRDPAAAAPAETR